MDVGTSLNPAIDIGQVSVTYLIAETWSVCFCCIDNIEINIITKLSYYLFCIIKTRWKNQVEYWKRFREGFFSANDLLLFLCYVLVFRFSFRSKALSYKVWVCILLKKYDFLRLAHHGRRGLGRTRFPDLQTYQWSSMCIFCAVLRTKKPFSLLRFKREVV